MGFIKLALIGGAAYYAGKKFNEGNNGNPQQGPPNGRCQGWGRNWQDRHNRHHNPDMSQQQGPGMNRDMQGPPNGVYENNEKAHVQQQQYQQQQQQDYPAGYGNGWGYAQQYQDFPRDTKQVIKIDDAEKTTAAVATPPAYGRPLSPQQRMYPQQESGYATERPQWK